MEPRTPPRQKYLVWHESTDGSRTVGRVTDNPAKAIGDMLDAGLVGIGCLPLDASSIAAVGDEVPVGGDCDCESCRGDQPCH